MSRPRRHYLSLILLLAALPATVASANAIKKWVDDAGVTHYGTSIPPRYVDQPHTELNQRGITIKQVGRAKTAEELARERELEELRKAQQKAIAEQRAKDRILLNMFRTEDDLVMARDGKLEQVNALIRLKKAQVERLKNRLAKWQAAAATRERQGRKPTKKQLENLNEIKQQLENAYANIVEKETVKRRILNQYAYELKRFRQLKSGFRASSSEDIETARQTSRVIEVPGAYICRDKAECDRIWPYAKTWTQEHSGTPIEVIGNRILVTKIPSSKDQISLTLSRITRNNVERLFLDINCHKSVAGNKLCASTTTQALRAQFVNAMRAFAEKQLRAASNNR